MAIEVFSGEGNGLSQESDIKRLFEPIVAALEIPRSRRIHAQLTERADVLSSSHRTTKQSGKGLKTKREELLEELAPAFNVVNYMATGVQIPSKAIAEAIEIMEDMGKRVKARYPYAENKLRVSAEESIAIITARLRGEPEPVKNAEPAKEIKPVEEGPRTRFTLREVEALARRKREEEKGSSSGPNLRF